MTYRAVTEMLKQVQIADERQYLGMEAPEGTAEEL